MDEQDFEDDEFLECVEFLEATIKADGFRRLPPPSVPATVPAPEMTTTTILSSLSHPMQLQSSAGQRKKIPVRDSFFSYSPPRELSQRVGGSSDALMDYSNATVTAKPISPTSSNLRCDSEKDLEIDRLKKELGRVSKQLLDLNVLSLKRGKTKKQSPKACVLLIKGNVLLQFMLLRKQTRNQILQLLQ